MSLFTHIAVLVVLIIDLILGATLVANVGGSWAASGFEFLLILGYILFVLRVGPPWSRSDGDRPE